MLKGGDPFMWGIYGRHNFRLQRLAIPAGILLLLLHAFSAIAQSESPTFTFFGSISNVFFLKDQKYQETRDFKVAVRGADSSYDITNSDLASDSHLTINGGDYSYATSGPYTNNKGEVSRPLAARMERRLVPRDDGSWINNLWLAFVCNHYFTNRTDLSALPIWPTGLKAKDEARMGTTALYTALPGARFPSEVVYLSDGVDYFEGGTAGVLQHVVLRPPLNKGYTNFWGRAITSTTIQGISLPMEFEIYRYGPDRSGNANTALRVVQHSYITVKKVSVNNDEVMQPKFSGVAVVLDTRLSSPESKVPVLYLSMTNGVWPGIDQARKHFEVQQKLLERSGGF